MSSITKHKDLSYVHSLIAQSIVSNLDCYFLNCRDRIN